MCGFTLKGKCKGLYAFSVRISNVQKRRNSIEPSVCLSIILRGGAHSLPVEKVAIRKLEDYFVESKLEILLLKQIIPSKVRHVLKLKTTKTTTTLSITTTQLSTSSIFR